MILDRIEVSYPRAILNYVVRFFESRKPTYIEFILIKLILSYADREQKIINILKNELVINNTSLFDRAMRDLINFNVVFLQNKDAEIEETNYLNFKLSELNVTEKIKKNFFDKKYLLSNIEKTVELNFVYDHLTKKTSIYKKIDWVKKNPDSLNYFKLFSQEDIDFKMNISDIKEQTLNLMHDDPETFGDKFKLVNLELQNETHILDIEKDIDLYYKFENVATDVAINFDEKKYEIETENLELKKYFSKNKRIENDFINNVIESYNKKINEVIDDKKDSGFVDLSNSFLLQNFPFKNTEYDFLFFNFKDLKSRSKFIERPKYIENSKILFEFNVNDDEIRIGYERKKILIATNNIKNINNWKHSTLIYSNYNKEINAYSIEKVFVPSLKEKVFIAKKIMDVKNTIKKDLQQTYLGIRDIFTNSLKFGDYDKVALCIGILTSLKETSVVEKIMYERFYSDLKYAREYSAIKKSLLKYNLKNEIFIIEEIICELILKLKHEIEENEFINIFSKYQITSREIILKILKKIDLNFDLHQIIGLNSIIEKYDLNVWNLNINDSLIKYMNSLFQDDSVFYNNDSSILNGVYNFINKYKIFVNNLNKKTIDEIRKDFIDLDKTLKFLTQNIDNEMNNKVDFLHAIGKLLNTPFKFYNQLILNEIKSNKDTDLSKLKIMAYNFILESNKIISENIMKSVYSESVEINKTILQFTKDESGYYNAIGDEFKLNDCLDIFYTYDEKKSSDIIRSKIREIEGK